MNVTFILDRLRKRIGLQPESVGLQAVAAAVSSRMKALALSEPLAYAKKIDHDPREFQALVDDVVVAETWFFRGPIFEFLADHLRRKESGRSRVLSVPCSTGEEPYSLAMALSEAGVRTNTVHIDAVDLSRKNLDKARRGIFGEMAFRQMTPERRDRHFHPSGTGWEIDAVYREAVQFQSGNLMEPLFLNGEAPFDLILCRNLFIYLHAEARRIALNNLFRLLLPHGLLAVGHAEPLDEEDRRFRRFGPQGCFLYRKEEENLVFLPSPPRNVNVTLSHPAPLPLSPGGEGRLIRAPIISAAATLDRARSQADSGQLDQALATCQALLKTLGPSVELFCLCGLIHQARHDPGEAALCYQKVIYLQPNHREALLHLVLLREQSGDREQARLLRRRLERLGPEVDS